MRKMVLLAIILAMVVIVLGAYTRLTDAGLGCPDWPGCYGHLTVPQSQAHIQAANMAFPDRPVEVEKAWNEMIHRYFASALGILILLIFIFSYQTRAYYKPLKLPFALLCLVLLQGALGMWTVTLNLLPVVVMAHLLGGFTLLSGLLLLYLRLTPYRIPGGDSSARRYSRYATVAIVVLFSQIALGGWTAANYAALACTDLPICAGNWSQRLDFSGAFTLPAAANYEFGVHNYEQRMTMHIVHRFGALLTFAYLGWLGVRLYCRAASAFIRNSSLLMLLLLIVQVGLGVSNVVFSLPLTIAVLHNAMAACLLLVMVAISYSLKRKCL